MERYYPNNIVFRILFPAIAGMILYLAMLTIFDSLDQIGQSFFSQEALFIVILTYLNHETGVSLLRLRIKNRILYFILVLAGAVLLNTVLTMVYFIYILGYMHFRTELLTINVLFLSFHAMLNLYYLSIEHMSRVGDLAVQREQDQARQLELELESFQNEMNPGLLMTCLETLINLIHGDAGESEKYISSLSGQYRYILDQRHREITDIQREIEAAGNLVYLLGHGIKPGMVMESLIKDEEIQRIIPGSLLYIVNWIYNNMIIDPLRPVNIRFSLDERGDVLVSHSYQPRLKLQEPGTGMEKLHMSYMHYTGRDIEKKVFEDFMEWIIPGLPEVKEN